MMHQAKASALAALSAVQAKLNSVFDARWNNAPLAQAPRATREAYLGLWEATKNNVYPEIDAIEHALGFSIQKSWLDELALQTQIVIKKSDLMYVHGRLLYSQLRAYINEHQGQYITVLETGTARGFSALCMAKALDDAKAPGHIVSLDVLPHNAPIYWNCIADQNGKNTRSALLANWSGLDSRVIFVQGDAVSTLPKIGMRRVNFAFLDAQHIEPNVIAEFQYLLPRQQSGDVIFFDDVTPQQFPGVVSAVDAIEANHPYRSRRITMSDQRGFALSIRQ